MFNNLTLSFAPYFPIFWILTAAILLCVITFFAAGFRVLPTLVRSGLISILAIIALNPEIHQTQTFTPPTEVLILKDDSESMSLFERPEQIAAAIGTLRQQLALAGRNTKITEQELGLSNNTQISPAQALEGALLKYRGGDLGAVYVVTDGGLYDVDADFKTPLNNVPIHTLLIGQEAKFDVRPDLISAPKFAVVGDRLEIKTKVMADGDISKNKIADIVVRIGQDILFDGRVRVNEPLTLDYEVTDAGRQALEIQVAEIDGELTPRNNTITQELSIVRQRLRVLLVSGSPYPGQRTWRDLLKSDAGVDLVHFTILRTPFKQDSTPVNEMALIPFPTEELFIEQIDTFDLIIFDRYTRSGILQFQYFASIRDRILNGGALLNIAGPGYETGSSIANTLLGDILPGFPTGEIIEEPYRPRLTELGKRHPIVASLDKYQKNASDVPEWGHWTRVIGTQAAPNSVLMNEPSGNPLLMAHRVDQGRVVQLNTDQIWLWARGFDGGGPYQEFVKNIIHWLLKQPDLEEEKLTLSLKDGALTASRQTLETDLPPADLFFENTPIGTMSFDNISGGNWTGTSRLEREGRYTVRSEGLEKTIWYGQGNNVEFQSLLTTEEFLRPLAQETGAAIRTVSATDFPETRYMPATASAFAGPDWTAIRQNDREVAVSKNISSLLQGLLVALLFVFLALVIWLGERRV